MNERDPSHCQPFTDLHQISRFLHVTSRLEHCSCRQAPLPRSQAAAVAKPTGIEHWLRGASVAGSAAQSDVDTTRTRTKTRTKTTTQRSTNRGTTSWSSSCCYVNEPRTPHRLASPSALWHLARHLPCFKRRSSVFNRAIDQWPSCQDPASETLLELPLSRGRADEVAARASVSLRA